MKDTLSDKIVEDVRTMIKITKKDVIVFTLGTIFANSLLAIRMLNPELVNEAVFYIQNYKGTYFLLHGIINLSFGLIMFSSLIIIDKYYKRKCRKAQLNEGVKK